MSTSRKEIVVLSAQFDCLTRNEENSLLSTSRKQIVVLSAQSDCLTRNEENSLLVKLINVFSLVALNQMKEDLLHTF